MEVTSGGYLPSAERQRLDMENFSFKCSKIVKNALYLKKKARTVTHECQKVNSGGYLLFIVQSEARVKCYLLVWQKLMYFIPCLEKYSQSEARITVAYSTVCNG